MGKKAQRLAIVAAALLVTGCQTTPERLGHALVNAGTPAHVIHAVHSHDAIPLLAKPVMCTRVPGGVMCQ